jgi:hypothetical protein
MHLLHSLIRENCTWHMEGCSNALLDAKEQLSSIFDKASAHTCLDCRQRSEAELHDSYLRSTAMLSRVKPQSLSSRKSYQTGLSEALTSFTNAQMTWMHDIRNVLQI